MTKVVTVLPFVLNDWMAQCVDRCQLDNLVLVDNTVHNRGIMRSHNIGRKIALEQNADWLLVLSAAINFGDAGGLDFVAKLDELGGEFSMINANGTNGWHMIAFRRDLLLTVGQWDENYSPYSLDDVDYAIRAWKASEQFDRPQLRNWCGVDVDVTDRGMGHSHKLGGVHVRNEAVMTYFARKWGRGQGGDWAEYSDHPFADAGFNPDGVVRSIDWWPNYHHHYTFMGSDIEIVGRHDMLPPDPVEPLQPWDTADMADLPGHGWMVTA